MQEEQVLPHLAAIAILLAAPAGPSGPANGGHAQLARPDSTAGAYRPAACRGHGPDLMTRTAGCCGPAVATPRPSSSALERLLPAHARPGKGGPPRDQPARERLPSLSAKTTDTHALTQRKEGLPGKPGDCSAPTRPKAGHGCQSSMPVTGRSWGFNVSEGDLNP